MNLDDILRDAVERGVNDIILGSGERPGYRMGGELFYQGEVPISEAELTRMFYEVLTPSQISRLEQEFHVDLSLSRGEDFRFRMNLFYRDGGLAAAIRPIPQRVPSPKDFGIPATFAHLLDQASGLIMVVGRVGMGKSTLCASFLDYLNRKRGVHIITLEDPIEFRIRPKKAVISQREMREHATSFESALKAILRQSPDVIYVGEMRDMETISATLSVAESGHLVLANLHTANAIQTIHRLVGMFPPALRPLVGVQLANCLTAVLCQCLVPRADGTGLVAAREIMVMNPALANLIRKTELHQIQSVVDTSTSSEMRKMEHSLAELYVQGVITLDVARANAPEPEALSSHIEHLSKLLLDKGARR